MPDTLQEAILSHFLLLIILSHFIRSKDIRKKKVDYNKKQGKMKIKMMELSSLIELCFGQRFVFPQ